MSAARNWRIEIVPDGDRGFRTCLGVARSEMEGL